MPFNEIGGRHINLMLVADSTVAVMAVGADAALGLEIAVHMQSYKQLYIL